MLDPTERTGSTADPGPGPLPAGTLHRCVDCTRPLFVRDGLDGYACPACGTEYGTIPADNGPLPLAGELVLKQPPAPTAAILGGAS